MKHQQAESIESRNHKIIRILYLLPATTFLLSLFLPAYSRNSWSTVEVPGWLAVIESALCLSIVSDQAVTIGDILRHLFLASFAIANLSVLLSVVNLAFRTPRLLCILHTFFGATVWLIPVMVDHGSAAQSSLSFYLTNFGSGFVAWAFSLGLFAIWTFLNRYAVEWQSQN